MNFELINNLSTSTLYTIIMDLEKTYARVEKQIKDNETARSASELSVVTLAEMDSSCRVDKDYLETIGFQLDRIEEEAILRRTT